MKQFEYKSVLLEVERYGFFSSKVDEEVTNGEIEETLNELGHQGWELTAVLPITNGGSPAQINVGLHYFKRAID